MFEPPGDVQSFRQTMVVAASDIDALGHASNVAYIRWVQDVAKAHSEHLGWGLQAYVELGAVFVVRRHEIDYLRPAFEGDELLMTTWVDSWKAATTIRQTQISRPEDGCELARAATRWALISTDTGRPLRIPRQVRDAFGRDDSSS